MSGYLYAYKSTPAPGRWIPVLSETQVGTKLDDLQDQLDGIVFNVEGIYEPLTNGNVSSPELIFADGDVIMVKVLE